jgi:hypothetical protein
MKVFRLIPLNYQSFKFYESFYLIIEKHEIFSELNLN